MFIDSHAHIYNEYYENLEKVKNDSKESNVLKIINCATSINNFSEIINASKKHGFYYVLGIHPEEIDKDERSLKKIESYIKENLKNPKFVGIGEIGLDYYYSKENEKNQKEAFEYQLSLAAKYNLPVIIHSREATLDTINTLKKYNVKGIIHCFSGSLETAKEYIKLGYKIGIGGVITFKNCNLKDYIKEIGIENIVLETDCPYMTPEPFRKYKNEPKYIKVIAEYLTKILDLTLEDVGTITTCNCAEIFDFDKEK